MVETNELSDARVIADARRDLESWVERFTNQDDREGFREGFAAISGEFTAGTLDRYGYLSEANRLINDAARIVSAEHNKDSAENRRVIDTERAKLERELSHVSGSNQRDKFRGVFEMMAGSLMMGRRTPREFKGATGELIRDVQVVAGIQDRAADRRKWATMPTDGSGRLQWIDRVIFGMVAVAVLLTLGWVAGLLIDQAQREDARTAPVSVSTAERDRELIIQGGSMSWAAFTECGNGPAACDAILRELNANPYGVRVFEDGSLIEVERTEDMFTVTLSGPTYGN